MADRFPGGTFVRLISHHNTRIRVHQFGSLLRIHCRAEFLDGNQPHRAPRTVGCSLAHCDVVEGAERVAPKEAQIVTTSSPGKQTGTSVTR